MKTSESIAELITALAQARLASYDAAMREPEGSLAALKKETSS